jgi:hypothetical protein
VTAADRAQHAAFERRMDSSARRWNGWPPGLCHSHGLFERRSRLRALDGMSFAQWLDGEHFTSPVLRAYLLLPRRLWQRARACLGMGGYPLFRRTPGLGQRRR